MEELLTVDEVGGEDDSIVEPDLPDLQEEDQRVEPVQSATESPKPIAETPTKVEDTVVDPPTLPPLDLVPEESSGGAQSCPGETPLKSSVPEQPVSQLNQFPSHEFKSALEETCTATDMDTQTNTATPAGPPNHSSTCESGKVTDSSNDEKKEAELDNKEPCLNQDSQKKGTHSHISLSVMHM